MAKFPEGSEDFPDGMTIDTDDNIWIAHYYGGKITKWDPRKGKNRMLKNYQIIDKLLFNQV